MSVTVNIDTTTEDVNITVDTTAETVNVNTTTTSETVNINTSSGSAFLELNGNEFLTVATGSLTDILLLDQDDDPITPLSVVGNTIKVTQGGGVLITNSDDTYSENATPPTFELPDTDYNININGVFYASTSLPTLAP